MFAPQFSLRKLLLLIFACCLFTSLGSVAMRGELWPIPFLVVGVASAVAFILYAVVFLIAWIFSTLLKDLYWKDESQSPFAQDRPAPQILPPDQTL